MERAGVMLPKARCRSEFALATNVLEPQSRMGNGRWPQCFVMPAPTITQRGTYHVDGSAGQPLQRREGFHEVRARHLGATGAQAVPVIPPRVIRATLYLGAIICHVGIVQSRQQRPPIPGIADIVFDHPVVLVRWKINAETQQNELVPAFTPLVLRNYTGKLVLAVEMRRNTVRHDWRWRPVRDISCHANVVVLAQFASQFPDLTGAGVIPEMGHEKDDVSACAGSCGGANDVRLRGFQRLQAGRARFQAGQCITFGK